MGSLGNRAIFSKNLKRYMAAADLNRADLADLMGVAYTTVNDWYQGNTYPRIDKIEWLANYFGVQKSDLIEDKTVDNPDYYIDQETQKLAEVLATRRDLKALLSSARKARPEDIQTIITLMESLTEGVDDE